MVVLANDGCHRAILGKRVVKLSGASFWAGGFGSIRVDCGQYDDNSWWQCGAVVVIEEKADNLMRIENDR
ncbi:hypothetical protein QVD17_37931 [Tagetes erecta]|uniref:Uncharacterized protein n=1 Tax=Tagetes erecta TaxID=13708 RepID=A0AAD8JX03_TARER|nr:hypothetical protein QVD17_37931 [Tagetes erecta]